MEINKNNEILKSDSHNHKRLEDNTLLCIVYTIF